MAIIQGGGIWCGILVQFYISHVFWGSGLDATRRALALGFCPGNKKLGGAKLIILKSDNDIMVPAPVFKCKYNSCTYQHPQQNDSLFSVGFYLWILHLINEDISALYCCSPVKEKGRPTVQDRMAFSIASPLTGRNDSIQRNLAKNTALAFHAEYSNDILHSMF